MPVRRALLRPCLGLLWTAFGALKVLDPDAGRLALIQGIIEVGLGCWLLVGFRGSMSSKLSTFAAAGLVLWNVLPATLRPGPDIECGCLGAIGVSESQRLLLASIVLLLSILALPVRPDMGVRHEVRHEV